MLRLQRKLITRVGPLYLVASEFGLQGVFWEEQPFPFKKEKVQENLMSILDQAQIQIEEYLNSARKNFSLSLDIQGTEFQKKVWKALTRIPYGKTISYKELAIQVQNEKASRAVGTANGKNPLSLIIPCHRVISSDGTLGGYAGGLTNKKTLLNLERSI